MIIEAKPLSLRPELNNLSTLTTDSTIAMSPVHFDGVDEIIEQPQRFDTANRRSVGFADQEQESSRSLMTAPPAPPHEHRRTSLNATAEEMAAARRSMDDSDHRPGDGGGDPSRWSHLSHKYSLAFGGVSKRAAWREIRRNRKTAIINRRGWEAYSPHSTWTLKTSASDSSQQGLHTSLSGESVEEESAEAGEGTALLSPHHERQPTDLTSSVLTVPETEDTPWEALKEMFLENRINVLFAFIPLAYWSHAAKWSDGSVFILNFLAMVPLASMLGVFTEELAAHTNDVIGGLINATFGNAVELVVAIQALLANDFRVVQASLIGSVFSNVLLVLGMCFFFGGVHHKEQQFIAQGAVASIALLGLSGMALLMPQFFGSSSGGGEGGDAGDGDVELTISRIGAILLILMYGQLLFFQLKTHVHLFEGDDDVVALIPFKWAMIGLVVITAIVTVLSEWLVGSIDGFCEEFNLGRSFVGVIILPVVGNAVEHISAVSVAMKNKMDLALGGECFAIVAFRCTALFEWECFSFCVI